MKYDLTTTDNGEFLLVMQGDEIIAHLPLKEKTDLLNVDLLPPLPQGEDVEELAKESVPDGFRTIWKNGYNKAKETYKYTEFDIIQAFEYGWNQRHFGKMDEDELQQIQQKFIQSLQQQPKLPIAFECETETLFVDGFTEDRVRRFYGNPEPKTITNSQGQTEWVGKYIYE